MGKLDRVLRFVLAAVIIGLYFFGILNGLTAIILLTFALATTLTGITGYCPLYPLFGWNTCKRSPQD
ncbi:MAG: DUF2892 domain-containing protein [Alteromonas sp.]|nr:DUF2892 domain-containing protein [Flavobacteriaceae bacterium]MCB9212154.1 DUF2892 domain-containing protein [Alteromonas sp.]